MIKEEPYKPKEGILKTVEKKPIEDRRINKSSLNNYEVKNLLVYKDS